MLVGDGRSDGAVMRWPPRPPIQIELLLGPAVLRLLCIWVFSGVTMGRPRFVKWIGVGLALLGATLVAADSRIEPDRRNAGADGRTQRRAALPQQGRYLAARPPDESTKHAH